ncbi:MAG: hypothetical protein JO307_09440 [Bryobacterales bacterium]|nr:hypothetical protein [Bryobacterales bacterium]
MSFVAKITHRILLPAAFLFACIEVTAQLQTVLPNQQSPEPQYVQVRRVQVQQNTLRLRVTLALDEQYYLPGEAAQIGITITNPTPDALEVWEPFRIQTGELQMWPTKLVNGKPTVYGDRASCCMSPPPVTMTQWVAAGQTISRMLTSADRNFDSTIPYPIGAAPQDPGDYRLVYTYGAPNPLDFHVLSLTIENVVSVPLLLPRQVTSAETGKVYQVPRRLVILILGGEGMHYIAISQAEVGVDSYLDRAAGQVLSSLSGGKALFPIVRVGVSAQGDNWAYGSCRCFGERYDHVDDRG